MAKQRDSGEVEQSASRQELAAQERVGQRRSAHRMMPPPPQQSHPSLHQQQQHREAVAVPVLRDVWGTMQSASNNSSSSAATAAIRPQQQQRGGLPPSSSSSPDAGPTHLLHPHRLHDRFVTANESGGQQLQSPILLPPAKWHHTRASMTTTGSSSPYKDNYEDEDDGEMHAEATMKKQKSYEPQHHQGRHHNHCHHRPTSLSSSSAGSSLPASSSHLTHQQQPFSALRPPPPSSSSSLSPPVASLSLSASSHSRQSAASGSTPVDFKVAAVRSTTPSDPADKESARQQTPPAAGDTAVGVAAASKKRTRYLRDTDRRNIIQRIENGEKQAALAREFGVTRAAICHIKKNREEIITRYDLLVQSAKDLDSSVRSAASPPVNESVTVLEARSHAVLILLTTLRNMDTNPAEFRRAACRLIMILLEEAIASLGSKSVQITTPSGHTYLGRQQVDQLCGVVISDAGYPFLKFFNQMEPDAARGYIHMDPRRRGEGEPCEWHVERTDLPPNVAECKVLLFCGTSSDGGCVCKAVEVLRGLQILETRICVVMVLSAAEAVSALCSQYPEVKIITTAVDADVDARTGEILPGLGDFMARYNSD